MLLILFFTMNLIYFTILSICCRILLVHPKRLKCDFMRYFNPFLNLLNLSTNYSGYRAQLDNYLDCSRSRNSVTHPLYLSCTVTTGTPTSSYILLKISKFLHSAGNNLLIPGTSQAAT